jgi:hypothetical protein
MPQFSALTDDLTASGRSFMWQRNSMVPGTVPCGTPESTVTCWDDSPINDPLKSYDKGKQIDMAILDISKAFDTVPHKNCYIN